MARRSAVVISHAPGLHGTLSAGHCSSAAIMASWASSSAWPTSPTSRISPAISRGASIRQTAAAARWASVGMTPVYPTAPPGATHSRMPRARSGRRPADRRGAPGATLRHGLLLLHREVLPEVGRVENPPDLDIVADPSPGRGTGQRLNHSTHSSSEFIWTSQNPPISSLLSVNGPSTTVVSAPSR